MARQAASSRDRFRRGLHRNADCEVTVCAVDNLLDSNNPQLEHPPSSEVNVYRVASPRMCHSMLHSRR